MSSLPTGDNVNPNAGAENVAPAAIVHGIAPAATMDPSTTATGEFRGQERGEVNRVTIRGDVDEVKIMEAKGQEEEHSSEEDSVHLHVPEPYTPVPRRQSGLFPPLSTGVVDRMAIKQERKSLLFRLSQLENDDEEIRESTPAIGENQTKRTHVVLDLTRGTPIVTSAKKEANGPAADPTPTIDVPPRFFPNPETVNAVPPEQRAYSAGVDLNQWATLLEGQVRAMRPQPEKPAKFFDQPLVGVPYIPNKADGSGRAQQTLKEWMDAVDVYFMLCGMKDDKVCFLFSMSLLGGPAKAVMEAAVRNPPILRIRSKNAEGQIVKVDLKSLTWGWLKEILRVHYHPAQRTTIVRDQLRRLVQSQGESVSAYYQKYIYYAGQLYMTDEEQYNDFRGGLQSVYREALNKVMQVRSGIPGAPETMTLNEALNIALQEEASLKHQSQLQQSRPRTFYPWSTGRRSYPSPFNNNSNSAARNGERTNSNTAQLSALEQRTVGNANEWNEDYEGGRDEYGYEEEKGQLNAVTSNSSSMATNMVANRSGTVTSPTTQAGIGDGRRCWICGQQGHFKIDCPHRGRAASYGGRSASFQGGNNPSRWLGRGGGRGGRVAAAGGNRNQGKV